MHHQGSKCIKFKFCLLGRQRLLAASRLLTDDDDDDDDDEDNGKDDGEDDGDNDSQGFDLSRTRRSCM